MLCLIGNCQLVLCAATPPPRERAGRLRTPRDAGKPEWRLRGGKKRKRARTIQEIPGGDDDPDIDPIAHTRRETPRNAMPHRKLPALREQSAQIETCVERGARIWKKVSRKLEKDKKRIKNTKSEIQRMKEIREHNLWRKLKRPVFRYRPDLSMRAEVRNPYIDYEGNENPGEIARDLKRDNFRKP
eukprot:CAMPEP_0197541734 /NCGR_PEP_ID=MMETSP1318-20131121/67321_1 /TAXON_ID=552666 /ORGANISM="Partenskyella glossopodia, Strain RCC365" /LENGTH=185 /DNA_ID=CAMNT_0043100935 /DNA_START=406 /DNA_END=963 /DNA_ORIENTATION=+